MMAAANQRRLDDVVEVVFLVNERQVVVVHDGMGIGHRGGQMAMLGPRYNRSNLSKETPRCPGTTSMALTRCRT